MRLVWPSGFNNAVHAETKEVKKGPRIAKCLDAFNNLGKQNDTRVDSASTYLEIARASKDGKYTAIKTAADSGKFEDDLKRLDILSRRSGTHVIAFMNSQYRECAEHLDYGSVSQSAKEHFSRNFKLFIAAEKEMLAIVKKLEAAGRKMIQNGTPPVPEDKFVPLFR